MTQYSYEPAPKVNSFKYPTSSIKYSWKIHFKSSNNWLFETAEAGNKVAIKAALLLIFSNLKLNGNVKQDPKR